MCEGCTIGFRKKKEDISNFKFEISSKACKWDKRILGIRAPLKEDFVFHISKRGFSLLNFFINSTRAVTPSVVMEL